ncbi:TetR/AcrR family transcriptional regulator [Aureimonas mangrovi]|uniref:TetR/AcrR family transcriptional regulator n=1 Tax=Aureimonas mangrovi TaxID=2758041 RepID=UPI00163D63BC|nr:TetR/AcrR family transcriptional regulator [Aureimonas mangrovi]
MDAIGLKRKKQPDAVRRALLEAALQLGYEQGLAAVTVQAVAQRAGVTKGGLFHHFPSKEALFEGLFVDIIEQLDSEIDKIIAEDPEPYGSFTRAYIAVMLRNGEFAGDHQWAGLSAAFMADPLINQHWMVWLEGRLTRHADTDAHSTLEIVRYAVDGAWYAFAARVPDSGKIEGLTTRLVALTRTSGL